MWEKIQDKSSTNSATLGGGGKLWDETGEEDKQRLVHFILWACKIIFYGFMEEIHAIQFTVLRLYCRNCIMGQLSIMRPVERCVMVVAWTRVLTVRMERNEKRNIQVWAKIREGAGWRWEGENEAFSPNPV